MISDVPVIIIELKCILKEQILIDNELENYSTEGEKSIDLSNIYEI